MLSLTQVELVCAQQVDNRSFILISPFRRADKINNFDKSIFAQKFGYRFPCRADNAAYPHDGRADKRRYRHDRRADSQCRV